jgi:hypothetical protein
MSNNQTTFPDILSEWRAVYVHAHGAIQFAGLNVRLAANIAATRLLDERRKQDLLAGIADMLTVTACVTATFTP